MGASRFYGAVRGQLNFHLCFMRIYNTQYFDSLTHKRHNEQKQWSSDKNVQILQLPKEEYQPYTKPILPFLNVSSLVTI